MQHTKYYPLPSDLETSKLHFPGQVLAKNVHVLSQMVRTCTKFSCSHEAPFSSLLSCNGSCLPRQDILGLEVDGMDQAAAYWQIYTIVCPRDGKCVRARTQYVAQKNVPSRSHRYDVPEVEFKKNTPILTTLGDFCLSGLRRVFAGFANSKSSSTLASPRYRCHSAP